MTQDPPIQTAVRSFLQLGRNGDLINILPALYGEFVRTGQKPRLVVDVSYSDLLDGVSYVHVIKSPYQDFTAVQQAARWAGRNGIHPLTITQIHGRGWTVDRQTKCFAAESRMLCKVPESDWTNPVVFDQRNADREALLLDKLGAGPVVLYNGTGRSAPFHQADRFGEMLRDLCNSLGASLFDISELRVHRLYDLIALYEKAVLLVTVDTATLHLAGATPQLPVISLLPDHEDTWRFATEPLPSVNVVMRVPYSKWRFLREEISEAVQKATKLEFKPCLNSVAAATPKFSIPSIASLTARRSNEAYDDFFAWGEVIQGNGIDLWPVKGNELEGDNITAFTVGSPHSVRLSDTFPEGLFDFVHCIDGGCDIEKTIIEAFKITRDGGHIILVHEPFDQSVLAHLIGAAIVRLNREIDNGFREIVIQKTKAEPFTRDYYMNGPVTGISNYSDYHWIPELTIPACRAIAEHLGMRKKASILDVGAARGFYVKAFRELGFEAYGNDISEWAVENCDPAVKEWMSTAIPAREFDWVTLKDVAEHIPVEKLSALIEGLSAITLKGMFFVVPIAESSGGRYLRIEDESDVTHVNRWTLDEWISFLEDNAPGFTVSASYHIDGIKPASVEVRHSCGFLTLTKK